ncbi:hypothetical protein [Streptomyces sp. NPDC097619]|uniref:hypothetical protein n=1 Tax=Streptomyces sp. NPDC097619 TaxID=3157228 RepID=UPI003326CAE1
MGGMPVKGTDGLRRAPGACACVLLVLAALGGCSSGPAARAPAASGTPARTASPTPSATPAPTPAITTPPVDPAKAPHTRAEAVAVLEKVIADARLFDTRVRPATPYESRPGTFPVLDADCLWQTGPLPEGVLAARTRYFRLPARTGGGDVEITATVTVHGSEAGAGGRLARSLEDAMRCPDQRLRDDQRLTGLTGVAMYYGEFGNVVSHDTVNEYGTYTGPDGSPQKYVWVQSRYGPVTMAVSVKNAPGVDWTTLQEMYATGHAWMVQRAKIALGKAA